jgi:hypothetical protein
MGRLTKPKAPQKAAKIKVEEVRVHALQPIEKR